MTGVRKYAKALPTFPETMKKCENEAVQNRTLGECHGERLSSRMWDSWQSGDFWIMYAARNNFAFDAVYWKTIDRRFFGSTEYDNISDVWRKRLHLLEPEEVEPIEDYVKLKLEEKKEENGERLLAWDADEYTVEWAKRLSKMAMERKEREERDRGNREKEGEC